MTSALYVDGPGHFNPEKEHRYPLSKRLHGLQSLTGRFGEKTTLLVLAELERCTVQPVASRYIDDIPALMTAVTQWLRCCATIWKVAGSIQAGVSGFLIDIKSFRSYYGPGVDSASNRNEYQAYFLGVKATGAYG